jgi:hypothetical protein
MKKSDHGGRPPVGAERRRSVHVASYITEAEAAALDRLCAELGGVSRSDAIREALYAATGVAIQLEVQP